MESFQTLPKTRPESIINDVYKKLLAGKVLTSLDGVNASKTVCLCKYVSLLRLKYNIPVQDRWITLANDKRIKEFYLSPSEEVKR